MKEEIRGTLQSTLAALLYSCLLEFHLICLKIERFGKIEHQ
jgi:hypothetical protein